MEPRKGCRICMRDLPPGAPNSRDYFCRRASPPSGSNLQILQPTSSSVEPCGIDTSIPAQSSGPSHSNPDISHDLLYSGRTYFEKKDFWRGEKMRGVTLSCPRPMRQLSPSRFPIAQRTRFHSPRHHRHLPRGKNQGSNRRLRASMRIRWTAPWIVSGRPWGCSTRSEEHTSELQSRLHLVCRLL